MAEIPNIAILPSPGMGHLIAVVELAKRLALHHNLNCTIIVPTTGPPPKPQKVLLAALPQTINHVFLPPVSFDDLPQNARAARLSLTISRSILSIREVLKSLVASTRLVALVLDLFGTDAIDVATEFKVSPYIFFYSTAMGSSLMFYSPKLDEMVSCDYKDLPEPVKLPGCVPLHGKDLPDSLQDRKKDAYKLFLHHAKRLILAEGIILNTFMDVEEEAIKAWQEDAGKPPVYPIGPLIQSGSSKGADESECLKWLDEQPSGSVLFVSFGSGGTLSFDQLHELAFGLELSEQKFLWVARSPNNESVSATYFSLESSSDPLNFLPKGFLDRTKEQGLVVTSWAPQIEVLSHGSIGGFVSHCGWNSILESIVHGVPLIAWPLFAEQKMIAVMVTEGLRVALRVKANENGVVGREEIAKVVKGLMEGEEGISIRNKTNQLKDCAEKTVSEDGSSTKSLFELVHKWKNQKSI